MRRILVTGANGFVGQALLRRLRAAGHAAVGAARAADAQGEYLRAPSLRANADWRRLVSGCEIVVHAAAQAHRPVATEAALAALQEANVAGTAALARQAAESGVRRFVFLSSIKVNGERTDPARPFSAEDAPAPGDAYGRSKSAAEAALWNLRARSDMEIVILRPPLVYGPGVKGNLLALLRWLDRGLPLPLASIRNRRSLIGIENLADLVETCVRHPAARDRIILASDGEDPSTPDLLRVRAAGLGRPARLSPLPVPLLRAGARLAGLRAVAARLCDSLVLDSSPARRLLDWTPPRLQREGLAAMAQWFAHARRAR